MKCKFTKCEIMSFSACVVFILSCTELTYSTYKLLNRRVECINNLKCSDVPELCKIGQEDKSAIGEYINNDVKNKFCHVGGIYFMASISILSYMLFVLFVITLLVQTLMSHSRENNSSLGNQCEAEVLAPNNDTQNGPPLYKDLLRNTSSAEIVPPITQYASNTITECVPPYHLFVQSCQNQNALRNPDKDPKPPSYESLFDNKQKRHNANSV